MHREAREFVSLFATDRSISVVEIGSLDVNGTIRDLFPNATWTGIDRVSGKCVDVVCDAAIYTPQGQVDLVVCCEVLEHADNWYQVILNAARWIRPGGSFIMTCAGLGRQPHSCDGGALKPHEYYQNLSPRDIRDAVQTAGFEWNCTRQILTDIQCFAVKKQTCDTLSLSQPLPLADQS